jgi:hypothetical protein
MPALDVLPALLALGLLAPPAAPPAAVDPPRPAPQPALAPHLVPLPPPPRALLRERAPAGALRIAVPDVKVQGELPAHQLSVFEISLLAELRKLEGLAAIGMGEIREMLSYEYQRQMLGCAADESCLAEIGGALGTDEMLHVSLIVDRDTVTLGSKRISMKSARITGSHQRRLTRAKGEELLGAIGPLVQALFPDRPLRAGRVRGVEKEVALRLNPPPLPRWTFFATAGAALAAAAGGATYGYLARDARSQYSSAAQRSLTESVSGRQLKDLEETASSRARTANVLFVASGVLAVAAGIEAFFTDWHGYRTAVEIAPGGAAVKVGGRF